MAPSVVVVCGDGSGGGEDQVVVLPRYVFGLNPTPVPREVRPPGLNLTST